VVVSVLITLVDFERQQRVAAKQARQRLALWSQHQKEREDSRRSSAASTNASSAAGDPSGTDCSCSSVRLACAATSAAKETTASASCSIPLLPFSTSSFLMRSASKGGALRSIGLASAAVHRRLTPSSCSSGAARSSAFTCARRFPGRGPAASSTAGPSASRSRRGTPPRRRRAHHRQGREDFERESKRQRRKRALSGRLRHGGAPGACAQRLRSRQPLRYAQAERGRC
jgi:hypothetical protein